MVIERALEKLKQSQAQKAGQPYAPVTAAPTMPTRRRSRERADAPPPRKLAFPQLQVDRALAERNRIALPESRLAGNAHVGAAYRMVRTRLLHTVNTNNWTTLAITSPEAGEGKSLTAINLALNVARDRTTSVFLIDLDMRNPSVCRYLGVQPPRELTGFFAGQAGAEGMFFSIGPENLAIAGSTSTTGFASELLAGRRLEDLIDYVKSVADNPLILIDLPPVLLTDEALLVAPRVDATLLVVSEGRTRRDSLVRAKTLLADFTSAGVILNRSSENLGARGYDYAYGYGASKS
jgi:capsular exopolysaccharide synthesis family protein